MKCLIIIKNFSHSFKISGKFNNYKQVLQTLCRIKIDLDSMDPKMA